MEREAALALVFLAFSLSGTVIKTDEPAPTTMHDASDDRRSTVIIVGWLGSANGEFDTLVQFYRSRYPRCTVLTTVGSSDRWADVAPDVAATVAGSGSMPPFFADGDDQAIWPAAGLCEEQVWRLAEAMLPPAGAPTRPPRRARPPPRSLIFPVNEDWPISFHLLRALTSCHVIMSCDRVLALRVQRPNCRQQLCRAPTSHVPPLLERVHTLRPVAVSRSLY